MEMLGIIFAVIIGIVIYEFISQRRGGKSRLQINFILTKTTSRNYARILKRLEKIKELSKDKKDAKNIQFIEKHIKELKDMRDKFNKILAAYQDKDFNSNRLLNAWAEYLDIKDEWSYDLVAVFEHGVIISDSHETDKQVILSEAYVELFDLWLKSPNYKHD